MGDFVGGMRDLIHGADQRVEVVLDGVEVAVVGVGDLRRHVALADAVDIVGGDVQGLNHRVENAVDAAHDVGVGAAELVVVAALGELAGIGRFAQAHEFLLECLQHDGDIVDCLLHLLVVALVGLGDQFVDLAAGDLRQDAVAFADGQQDGVEHGVDATHNVGIGALELVRPCRARSAVLLSRPRQAGRVLFAGACRTMATLLTANFIFSWSPL